MVGDKGLEPLTAPLTRERSKVQVLCRPPFFAVRPNPILAEISDVNIPAYTRVSKFEPVARERRVPELCGSAGGVPDPWEPGPSRRDGRVRVVADAFHRSRVRDRGSAGAFAEDAHAREFGDASGVVCCADDSSHGGVATCRQPEDGCAASADGVDP